MIITSSQEIGFYVDGCNEAPKKIRYNQREIFSKTIFEPKYPNIIIKNSNMCYLHEPPY